MIIMARTKQILSDEEAQIKEEYLAKIKEARERKTKEQARDTLHQYEKEYDHAKKVFFAVNGARRVLKSESA